MLLSQGCKLGSKLTNTISSSGDWVVEFTMFQILEETEGYVQNLNPAQGILWYRNILILN